MESPQRTGLDVLQEADVYVTKIGGDNAGKLRENFATVLDRQTRGKKQILAISAIRSSDRSFTAMAHKDARDRDSDDNLKEGFNTTSHLIAIAKCLRNGDTAIAHDMLERTRIFLKEVVHTEVKADPLLDAASANAALDAVIDGILDELGTRIDGADTSTLHELKKDWVLESADGYYSVTGVGEQLAQAIYLKYAALRNLETGAIGTEEMAGDLYGTHPAEVVENEQQSTAAIASLRSEMRTRVESLLQDHTILIAGGYLPVIASQRGYSDKTGALLAQAAKDLGERVAYLIEKEYPIMSDDPKKNDRARVIREMTFALAMELFGNTRGADGGAIHPDALNMLAEDDIDTVVFNPAREQRDDSITYIHHYEPQPSGIEIIASRKVPLAIQVSSTEMFGKPGFLSAVTTWFADRKISIDQVSTSERTTSFTFNNGKFKEQILRDFETFLQDTFGPDEELKLEMLRDQALIFCLGNNMGQTGPASRATMAMHIAGADIHFMTQGLNEQVMTFMIDRAHVAEVRGKLHRLCIEMDDAEYERFLEPLRRALEDSPAPATTSV
ncbi:hypothetical protein A2454_03715 [Candidatus Peribacteria bacterium RIFOXYC2_FULL_55_14]|nr:MAG: Aspartokinase [Candidatus Peribacteria bacterium GW2011_GWC2_54_8]KKW39369.1 MAG: Aspartokinase [Candidatus Peribacteria bacterium GW2011_GWB1_54_5]OGJ71507.1 MAG: hypothetical protein A2198_04860 [Candidatus Peribacteria bacterium RIFOXYA1_FULL_56_14]OGJ72900.1 MAG: hypothetical protein A2217_06375 [Candidatus Peribacteria bacterium RIFOXYA2_FULL_55_28]OGJ74808.1 MAG: hypothetical protein A2384_01995 [Candidatus Peribacteria bacterium RIFOXYB1_FULL_54_35]OGJ76066.1 MAG: hypothetical p